MTPTCQNQQGKQTDPDVRDCFATPNLDPYPYKAEGKKICISK
jgi:hypothetical protein